VKNKAILVRMTRRMVISAMRRAWLILPTSCP
jgi:hypothetical protein